MELKDFIGISGVPIVVALVAATKPYVRDKRAWPFIAILYAVAWNALLSYAVRTDPVIAAIMGIVVGLAASGLYSGVKTIGE